MAMRSLYQPLEELQHLKTVVYEKRDHIAHITLNRPEALNAFSPQMHYEAYLCWADVERDPDVWLAIVTGAGQKAFCAGRDVKALAQSRDSGERIGQEDPSSERYNMRGLPDAVPGGVNKPVIGAINGLAVGAGLRLVLSCDIRVMADHAWLGDQHLNVGQLGTPHLVLQEMPRVVACYLTFCNGRITAPECLRYGLVNEVVPADQVLPRAVALAEKMLENSPLGLRYAKTLHNLSRREDPALASLARTLDRAMRESEDGKEGARAFREKRRPVFVGR